METEDYKYGVGGSAIAIWVKYSEGGLLMEAGTEQNITRSAQLILEVAKQQKRLIWFILVQLLLLPVLFLLPPSSESAAWFILSLILGIICAYLIYKVCRALEISTFWLVIAIVVLFVPYIGLLSLLSVNSMATKFLRTAGVRVGLMGAKRKSMDRLHELA